MTLPSTILVRHSVGLRPQKTDHRILRDAHALGSRLLQHLRSLCDVDVINSSGGIALDAAMEYLDDSACWPRDWMVGCERPVGDPVKPANSGRSRAPSDFIY